MAVSLSMRFLAVTRLALVVLLLAAASRQASALTYDIVFGPIHPSVRLASTTNAAKWFIEFRSRADSPVGHSYVFLGVRTASGKERIVRIAGFYASMGPAGAVGSIVGVPGKVGYKKSDLGKPLIRYRLALTQRAFSRVERTIKRIGKNPGNFEMLANNCNAFVARIAHVIGLKTPRSTAIVAPEYVKQMIALNRH